MSESKANPPATGTDDTKNSDEKKSSEIDFDLSKKLTLDKIFVGETGFFAKCDNKSLAKETKGKRIFCRCDFNVPLSDDLKITDDTRITKTIPTINYLLKLKPKILILCSHLGRPKGQTKAKLSLKPVAERLKKLLNKDVTLISDYFKDDLNDKLSKYDDGSIILLENVRFYIEEEGKGKSKDGKDIKANKDSIAKFRKILTSIADMYVNDAFGTCHRGHSSMVGVDVSLKVAGMLVTKELKFFDKALSKPTKPYLAILGGSKVSDKIKVIEKLLTKVNTMIIAGGMCFTFLKVLNKMKIGKSLFDEPGSKIVENLANIAKKNNVKLILPVDFVCGDLNFKSDANPKVTNATVTDGIKDDELGLDIGPESIKLFDKIISESKTVVWNGPPGVFEVNAFANGTKGVLESIAKLTKAGGITIVGGGDSASACNNFGYSDKVSHVSTGGGASLELLEGKVLPGVKFLTDI